MVFNAKDREVEPLFEISLIKRSRLTAIEKAEWCDHFILNHP